MLKALTASDALILKHTRQKIDIDTLLDRILNDDGYDGEDAVVLLRKLRKVELRKKLRRIKGPDGLPLIWSIDEMGPDGQPIPKYKQLDLFTPEEFKQVYEYCRRKARTWTKLAAKIKKRAVAKYPDKASLFA